MTEWLEPGSVTVPHALQAEVGGHPLVARILAQRGVTTPQAARAFLDPCHYQPTHPDALPDLQAAVELLLRARTEGRRICVWGDFDVDGQTATALLVECLTRLGMDVSYYIPDRATEGHGLNVPALRALIRQGDSLILTCDCGVGDSEEIAVARRMGAEVIVTDHHELPKESPPAAAVVNPHRLPDGHQLSYLCGVGVAYMLLKALYEAASRGGQEEEWLDLVALGTIADVAILLKDNRYLVQRGLPQLLYEPRLGIAALLRTAGLAPPELLDTDVVGFTLAPRLNAVGRLADARRAVRLLLADDEEDALKLAAELEIYNDHRRRLCDEVEAQVEDMLNRRPQLLSLPALVLSSSEWHPGVIGIVASRLVERYGRPTILISTPPGKVGMASARSVPGLHIQEAISRHKDLLIRGGGHRMAAGFVIDSSQIQAFREAFEATVAEMLPEESKRAHLAVEGYVSLNEVMPSFVRELFRLAPFGAGNPAPVLACRQVRLENVGSLDTSGTHTRLVVEDQAGARVPAIWWRTAPESVPAGWVDIAFTVRLDEYAGDPAACLVLVGVQPRQPAPVLLEEVQSALPFAIEDMRDVVDREQCLRTLLRESGETAQVWAEGPAAKEMSQARDRQHLETGRDLIIWTIPPGPQELRSALDRVRPQRVYLLTTESSPELPSDFLRGLARVLKHVLSHQRGQTSFAELAAMTGQREATVRQGLDILAAKGKLTYHESSGELHIDARRVEPSGKPTYNHLKRLLQETAAYRRYFIQADLEDLLQVLDD
jgi:single-stranded-DNA-specific exonuclease